MRLPRVHKIQHAVTRAILGTITIASVTVALAAVPIKSARTGALDWARSLSPAERSAHLTPSRLAQLPAEYRRAVYSTLSTPDERCVFWRAVFQNFRLSHDLTAAQERALSRAELVLTPRMFESVGVPEVTRTVAGVRGEIETAFGEPVARELFSTAGADVRSMAALPVAERVRHLWRTERPNRLTAWVGRIVPVIEAGSCNCLYQSDCYYESTCGNPTGTSCEGTEYGCGDWWLSGCASICYYPIIQG